MSKSKSPLRYPGGKTRAVDVITSYFPENLKTLVSPFFGGGSIEIATAQKGVQVYGYDIFEPLACFWEYLLKDKQALYDAVKAYHPLSKDDFYELQKTNPTEAYGLNKAAVFYVLNRSSFSGSTMSGGMSPDHPRFNLSNMSTLLKFDVPTLDVKLMPFHDSLDIHKSEFAYLDPPYLLPKKQANKLYGVNGSTHSEFDHDLLFTMLKDRPNWIMSYNKSDAIYDLYDGFRIIEPTWKYGMSSDKDSKEVLIFSKK